MDGPPIQDGAVRILGDRIAAVGKFSDLRERDQAGPAKSSYTHDEKLIELRDSILMPGLINAHCHLDYTCLRGKIPPPRSFANWIRAINSEKAKLTPKDYLRSIADGLSEAQRFGTTSMVNLEAFPELIPKLQAMPLRVWWCAELIDVTVPGKAAGIVSAASEQLKSASKVNGNGFGLAPHAPFTASTSLYRACAETGQRDNLLLTTHLAESDEEMEMFYEKAGPLFDFLKSIGRSMDDCGNRTPLSVFLDNVRSGESVDANHEHLSGKWIIAHLNELAENDFELLSSFAPKFSVVHCPRSHAYFGWSPFAFERLDEIGFNVCLGTDSLASNEDLSLFREMREFRRAHPSTPTRKIVEMVTVNPANALGPAHRLGKIRGDCQADMIAIPVESADIYDSILDFEGEVPWAIISGKVINFSRFPLSFSQI
jgi:Cytosine deaminase and related metal-dependent hydrolases